MQLVDFMDIFEDNNNLVRDRFEAGLVNVVKNRPLVAKKHEEILLYINLDQSHQKVMECVSRSNNTQIFRVPC